VEEKEMTFREKLTEKADSLGIDISEHIEAIKKQMEQEVETRYFTVGLLKAKTDSFAIGRSNSCCYQTFIPKHIDESIYMSKFTNALSELGFSIAAGTMRLSAGSHKYYDSYEILLRW
jgi:hypothetical protein